MPETESTDANTLPTDGSAQTESIPNQSPSPNKEGANNGGATNEPIQEKSTADDQSANPTVGQTPPIVQTGEPAESPGQPVNDGADESTDDESTYSPAKRAYYLRGKEKRGIALSDSEREWLDAYKPGKPGRKAEPKPPAAAPVKEPPPPVESKSITTHAKVKSPPPTVHGGDKDWRVRYSGGVDGGRELLCLTAGTALWKWVVAMERTLKDAGIAPIVEVSDDATRNLFICAVDDLLPDYLKATPAIIATGKIVAITTQRVWKRKEIIAAMERKKVPLQVVKAAEAKVAAQTPLPPKAPPAPVKEAKEPDGESAGIPSTYFIR